MKETEVGLELLGLEPQQIKRTLAEKRRVSSLSLVDALTQPAPVSALQGSADRALFRAQRDTVQVNVTREGVRWVRYASATACGFSRMLAVRGAVYRVERRALWAHDRCHCLAVPDRDGSYELRAYVEQWQAGYEAARDGGARSPGQIAAAMDKIAADRAPKTADGGGRIPPGRFTPGGMDIPDDYPPMTNGERVPFRPANRPRPTDEDRQHVLDLHRAGANVHRKSMFRPDWSEDDIMAAIDVATAAPNTIQPSGDKLIFERVVDGELVRVLIRRDGPAPWFWTAYPPEGTLPA